MFSFNTNILYFYFKLKKNANILPILKKVMDRPFIKVNSGSKGRGRKGNWMVTVTEQTDYFRPGNYNNEGLI